MERHDTIISQKSVSNMVTYTDIIVYRIIIAHAIPRISMTNTILNLKSIHLAGNFVAVPGVFFALALLHSGQRSAATPPFVQLRQDEKSTPNLYMF